MPKSFSQLVARIRAFLNVSEIDGELDQELESHVVLLTDENIARGMAPDEARRAALLKLGGRESTKESHREVRGLPFLETLTQDLKYAFRTMKRDAAFVTFAILIIGLGIGASCTVFSVVNALLLRPLPFKDPAQLVWMKNHKQIDESDLSGQTTQADYVRDLRRLSKSYASIGGFMPFYGIGDTLLIGAGKPERLTLVGVTDNFFDVLGVSMMLGHNFEGQQPIGKNDKIILSYNYWKNSCAGDPNVIGKTMHFDGQLATIIGVLPKSFDFGNIFAPGTKVDVFNVFPLDDTTNRWGNTLAVLARLKPGVTIGSAQSETQILGAELTKDNPKRNDFDPFLLPLTQHVSGAVRPALILLACAVGLVMLIVCANLSNLLLARGATRQKEIAIRAALGATRMRLIRQMLTESIVLSMCGAVVGLFFAVLGTRGLAHLSGISIPLLGSVTVDMNALAFTALFAIATGLFFGMVPALHVPSNRLNDSLQESNRGSSAGKQHAWVRSVIVVSEIALACVLVVGAGLLIHSFLRVLDVNLGFRPEHVATLRVDPTSNYDTKNKVNAYFLQVLQRVQQIPGVTAAGITDALPYGSNRTWGVGVEGVQYDTHDYPEAYTAIVSPGYFKAMGIPVIAGRVFEENDPIPQPTKDPNAGPQHDAYGVINESLAKELFHGENPLGKRTAGGATIIGVVGDTRHLSLEKDGGNEQYYSMIQTGDWSSANLLIKSTLPESTLAAQLRTALAPIAPDLDVSSLRLLQSLVDKSVSPRRLVVMLLAGFAAFALILASLGIYAVISYSVSQRTQEIGIRMALGASAKIVRSDILKQTLKLAVIGIVIGVAASAAAAGALRSLLFGVDSADPATFLGMLVVLTVVALLAGYFPARRASRIDPMVALRTQ
jgi:predicted permease